MNEILFLVQVLLIVGFALGALRLGALALVVWVTVQALISNLFVLKQITLFGFDVTASDAFAIGSLLGLNFLQEYFDKEMAKKATWICFFFMLFFTLSAYIHLQYIPNQYDFTHNAFVSILSQSPRLLFASMSVFFVVQQFDIRFFAFLKNRLPNKSFALRAAMALLTSQILDTTLFSIVGLYGIVASLLNIIVFSLAIKLMVISCFSLVLKGVKG
jgi:uncharacterized integral membrane protein (TIGR00697 family)